MSRHSEHLPDPHAVVAGKVRAKIEQLFALVHEVNPTDRMLPPRDRAARYALKSRLQSLLIRHHAEVLAVRRSEDGIVSIHHRHADRDAAHAVVAELDDDARRWVETQLALGGMPQVTGAALPSSQPPPPTPKGDALALGKAALEVYDYDAARMQFAAALRHAGAAEAARLLIDLLVNVLGDDEAAIQAEATLLSAANDDRSVRDALALAAARVGDRDRATRLARGTTDPHVHLLLAELALRDADVADAARLLGAARERDPVHPGIARVAEAVGHARRQERRPAEDALATSLAAGDTEDAERQARALLHRWPDSELARRIIAEANARAQQAEARRQAEAAWHAYARGDHRSAATFAQRARALAPTDAELSTWLDEAAEAAQEATLVTAMDQARMAARAGDYSAWLSLENPARAALRGELGIPALGWLEALGRGAEGIPAILAMEQALATPARALDLLSPHARLLRVLPEGRRLLSEAEGRAVADARAEFDAGLNAAEDAWLMGEPERAVTLARALDPRSATDPLRQRQVELLRVTEVELRQRAAAARVQELADRGELIAARDLARSVGLDARATALAEDVQRAFSVEPVVAEDLLLHDFRLPSEHTVPLVWLTEDAGGERAVLTSVAFGHVFVRVADVEDFIVRRAVMLRAPHATGTGTAGVHGDVLTVVGDDGWVLQLALANWEVRRWLPAPRGADRHAIVAASLAPGGRHLWTTSDEMPPTCSVYDLEDWPRARQANLPGTPVPLLGDDCVVRIVPGGGVAIHAPSGTPRSREPELQSFVTARVTVVPEGRAILGFGDSRGLVEFIKANPTYRAPLKSAPLGMFILRHDRMVRFTGMNTAWPNATIEVATSLDEERFYLKQRVEDRACVHIACDEGQSFGVIGETFIPASSVFLRDAGSRRVRLLAYGEECLIAPVFGAGPTAADGTPVEAGSEMESALKGEQDALAVERQRRTSLPLEGLLLPLVCATSTTESGADPLDEVYRHLEERRWPAALDALGTAGVHRLRGPGAQHASHVEAVCALWVGDQRRARAALARARAFRAGCRLDALSTLLDALDGDPRGVLGEYVQRLLAADCHLAAGDFTAARDQADHAWMWRSLERQGLLRLAAAWLGIEAVTPADRFRKRLVLATVCGCDARNVGTEIPLAASTRSGAEWAAVVARAQIALG